MEKEEEENMEQWNDVKSKNNTPIIIILVLIILGLGIFIFLNKDKLFEKVESNSNNVEEKENKEYLENEESITFSNNELQKYVDYIDPISSGPSEIIYNTDRIDANNLSASKKIELIGHYVYSKQKTSSDNNYSIIEESDVKQAVEEVYGSNTYEETTFNLNCGDYTLNKEDQKYYARNNCGGITDTLTKNKIIDYKATKNSLIITTAYVFADSNFHIYKDYEKKNIVSDFNETYSSDEIFSILEKYVLEHKNELNHLIYTFESTDGINYYFKNLINER